jgi:hypothetical protein
MWDEYRIGKSMPNQFIMMAVVPLYNRPNKKFSPEYWLGETREYEPAPGSTYWVETLSPPMWFADMLGDIDFSGCIDALNFFLAKLRIAAGFHLDVFPCIHKNRML